MGRELGSPETQVHVTLNITVFGLVARGWRAMHARAVDCVAGKGLLWLDVVILADANADPLIGKAPGEEGGLGHTRKHLARIDRQWIGGRSHHMNDLALNELEERETEAETTLNAHRHVSKDKEAAVRVIDILEAVQ